MRAPEEIKQRMESHPDEAPILMGFLPWEDVKNQPAALEAGICEKDWLVLSPKEVMRGHLPWLEDISAREHGWLLKNYRVWLWLDESKLELNDPITFKDIVRIKRHLEGI